MDNYPYIPQKLILQRCITVFVGNKRKRKPNNTKHITVRANVDNNTSLC